MVTKLYTSSPTMFLLPPQHHFFYPSSLLHLTILSIYSSMACASAAAERGHSVTLFDAASEIGGQFNMAKKVVPFLCTALMIKDSDLIIIFTSLTQPIPFHSFYLKIPGKEEFYETIRYFQRKLQATGVEQNLNTRCVVLSAFQCV